MRLKKIVKNEMKVMKAFVIEFSPFYTKINLDNATYWELIKMVKETAEKL